MQVTEAHIKELAETMQQADKDSVWATGHLLPEQAIRISLEKAEESRTFLIGDRVAAIVGVGKGSLLCESRAAWMLGSKIIIKHPRQTMYESKQWIDTNIERYKVFRNYVDARHTRSIRWLKWLGFTIYPAEPFGVDGLPFHPNELRMK